MLCCWYLVATVDQSLGKQRFKNPPDRLHERRIQGFVIVLEVNPTTQSRHRLFPFFGVSCDNGTALCIVIGYPHFQYHITSCDLQFLVNFIFYWQTMTIPTKTSRYIMTSLMCIPSDCIFDSSCENVTIMG